MVADAALAAQAPVALKVGIVFLFAGAHNWIELRYFLARLPVRWQKSRGFFPLSIGGVALLSLSYLALTYCAYTDALPWKTALTLYSLWCTAVVAWSCVLLRKRARFCTAGQNAAQMVFLAALLLLAWNMPEAFGVLLVFLHPLIALAIYEAELRRSHRQWVPAYRFCLGLVPVFLLLLWWQTGWQPLVTTNQVAIQVADQAGASVLTMVPLHFLVSALVFLEMLHYGVWLVAVPATSAGFRNWQPLSIPVAVGNATVKTLVQIAFAVSSLLVVALWLCFSADYVRTSEIYFTLAIVHVLAEFPFLIWAAG